MYDEFNDKLDKITDLAQEKVRRMSMPTYVDKKSNILKHHHLNEIESKSSIDTPADNNKIRKVFNILSPYYDRFDEHKPAFEYQTYKIMKDDDGDDAENRVPENSIQYSINDNSNLIDNLNEREIPIVEEEQQHENTPAYVENLKKYSCELCSVDDRQKQDQRRNCCVGKQLKIKRDTNEQSERKSENVQSSPPLSLDDPLKESNIQPSVLKVIAKNSQFE